MLWFSNNNTYPIGIDIGEDDIKIAQLFVENKSIHLMAGGSVARPMDVNPGSSLWQRWAIEELKNLTSNGKFKGKEVIAALPASDVIIENIKISKANEIAASSSLDSKQAEIVLSKIKHKLPCEPDQALLRFLPVDEDNLILVATEKEKVNRHLAIYEKTNLKIKSMNIWPIAMISTYVSFFGRRQVDLESIVMLVDIGTNSTNIVICKHSNLLFARSTAIGSSQLLNSESMNRLILELGASKKSFQTIFKKTNIERLIFLSGQVVEKDIYAAIAKNLEIPAQMGDCLAAVETQNPVNCGIDRRGSKSSWATAFGLGLSQNM
jgi:Tfp pilus assembly PilM family ATPase